MMEPLDVMGSLYSSAGLRFGGVTTMEFMAETETLESKRPGVRVQIITEAHWMAQWSHHFPEIAFLVGTLATASVWVGLISFVVAYLFEGARFHLFGSSRFLARISRTWHVAKYPVFALAALSTLSLGHRLPATFALFLVVQGWLGLLSTIGLLGFRIVAMTVLKPITANDITYFRNPEALALAFALDRWRRRVLV